MAQHSAPTPAAAIQILEGQAFLRLVELERYGEAPKLSEDDDSDESES